MVLCFIYQQGQSSPAGTEDRQMKHTMTKQEIENAIAKMPKTTEQMIANRKAWLAKKGLLLPTSKKGAEP
jgi:hypothetical protein